MNVRDKNSHNHITPKNKKKMVTFDEGDIKVMKRDDEYGTREIRGGREMERSGMVIESGEVRSKGDSRDVVLDEVIDIDDFQRYPYTFLNP